VNALTRLAVPFLVAVVTMMKAAWLTQASFGVIITAFWVFLRRGNVALAASRPGLSRFCWGWWCCTSSLNSPPQKYRYWGK
jgi:hypothetical protein